MKRLTAIEENGNTFYPYCFREDTCFGAGESEKCTECDFAKKVCETLAAYENTGLTPSQILEMKERDTAKAPEEIQDAFGDGRLICPNCRNSVINYFNRSRPPQFCMICGQRLKFGE